MRAVTTATTLPAEPRSVSAARHFVRQALDGLGAAAAVDDAQVLVCELGTNCVLHARTTFTVEVTRHGGTVRVCVTDGSAVLPRTRTYGVEATTGRGMRLVAVLASDWGVEPQGTGKTVWFELPVAGEGSSVRLESADVDALLLAFPEPRDGDPEAPQVLAAAA